MVSWKWSVWLLFSLYWTWLILSPAPRPEDLPLGEHIQQRRLLIAKTLHLAVYAIWAFGSGFLPLPIRFRFLLLAGLMGHGTATECLQWCLSEWSHRDGNMFDVAFDNGGVLLGFLAGWKAWTRPDETP